MDAIPSYFALMAQRSFLPIKGDLLTPFHQVKGGNANQITFHEAHDYILFWSKDCNADCFCIRPLRQTLNVFLMDAAGVQRLAHLPFRNDELFI